MSLCLLPCTPRIVGARRCARGSLIILSADASRSCVTSLSRALLRAASTALDAVMWSALGARALNTTAETRGTVAPKQCSVDSYMLLEYTCVTVL